MCVCVQAFCSRDVRLCHELREDAVETARKEAIEAQVHTQYTAQYTQRRGTGTWIEMGMEEWSGIDREMEE